LSQSLNLNVLNDYFMMIKVKFIVFLMIIDGLVCIIQVLNARVFVKVGKEFKVFRVIVFEMWRIFIEMMGMRCWCVCGRMTLAVVK
jgi:hypothetical protein